jgi:hypothetical protein
MPRGTHTAAVRKPRASSPETPESLPPATCSPRGRAGPRQRRYCHRVSGAKPSPAPAAIPVLTDARPPCRPTVCDSGRAGAGYAERRPRARRELLLLAVSDAAGLCPGAAYIFELQYDEGLYPDSRRKWRWRGRAATRRRTIALTASSVGGRRNRRAVG